MINTRNGFTVQATDSTDLVTFDIEGVPFKMWVPSVAAFRWFTTLMTAIEPVGQIGWDGAYAYRKIAGTDVWSEHAAGTAFDWNASQHPRGSTKYAGWTADQVRVIRWALATPLGKLIRWGSDFGDPDPMHFELRSKQLWDDTDGWWKA
jgi:hypothetical protein